MLLGALEAGGTKMVMAVGTKTGNPRADIRPYGVSLCYSRQIIDYFKD